METEPTHCFCGCGQRVLNPRLVVTNTTGWELSTELAEWLKLEMARVPAGEDFIDTGQELWVSLANSLHAGEKPDKLDEVNAVRWAKHSRKSRRKLKRRFKRSGTPNLFDLPTSDLAELRAWITEGERPGWAEEVFVENDDNDELDFGDIDMDEMRRQGEIHYRQHIAELDKGPDPLMHANPEQIPAARRIYEPFACGWTRLSRARASLTSFPKSAASFLRPSLPVTKDLAA